jgi:nicotinamidase-related amidase
MFPIDTKTTAFAFIDFQRDFCDVGGYANRTEADARWVREILPAAARLLAYARTTGAFIFHTREGYRADLADVSPWKLRKSAAIGARIGDRSRMGRYLIRGEYGHDFTDAMRPLPGETVLDKNTYGAFASTDLEKILRARGIKTLVLAGVTADICVHTTMREAVDRNFDCLYVRDAISTPNADIRKACEAMVLEEGGVWGRLVTVDEVTGRIG